MIQKLEMLRSLIDSEIMLQRAEKLGLMAVDADVETKLNELKAPYTKEEFEKQLTNRKMTLDDLKTQLRRQDLSIHKLFNKEITSHISISDADVAEFLQQQQGQLQPGRAAGPHGADRGDARSRPQRAQSEERQGAESRGGQAKDPDHRGAPAGRRGLRHDRAELLRGSQHRAERRRPGLRSRVGLRKGQPRVAPHGRRPCSPARSRPSCPPPTATAS